MLIRAGYHIEIDCDAATPTLLMLSVHPDARQRFVTPDTIKTRPSMIPRAFRDGFGNICHRLTAQPGRLVLQSDFVVEDDGKPDPVLRTARQANVDELPDEVMQYLLPSRYCETERMASFAWAEFSNTNTGWDRVQAVCDYVHDRIQFGYEHARCTRTAFEAHLEQRGVCRDFAHLAVSLCRCLNIPARYVTGYLGDIGVEPNPSPMDFSAWFQVWLGGRWWDFDARHNQPRIGRILMAVGRDAADVAMITSYGQTNLARFEIITHEIPTDSLALTG